MPSIHVTATRTQISQDATGSALIVNDGTVNVYLDDKSSVSTSAYSLVLAPGQSVNWRGGALWAICSGNGKLSYMNGGDSTVTPITNVTAEITGGSINVDTINGNVNVDGSVVEIGSSVKIRNGGDYLGLLQFTLNGASGVSQILDLTTIVPPGSANAGNHYSAIRLMVAGVYNLPNTASAQWLFRMEAITDEGPYNVDPATVLGQLCWARGNPPSVSNFETGINYMDLPLPVELDRTRVSVQKFHSTGTATVEIAVYGIYGTIANAVVNSPAVVRQSIQMNFVTIGPTDIGFIIDQCPVERTLYLNPNGGTIQGVVSLRVSDGNGYFAYDNQRISTDPAFTGFKAMAIKVAPDQVFQFVIGGHASNTGIVRFAIL